MEGSSQWFPLDHELEPPLADSRPDKQDQHLQTDRDHIHTHPALLQVQHIEQSPSECQLSSDAPPAHRSVDTASPQDQSPDQHLIHAAADQDEAEECGGGGNVPALVVTEAEEHSAVEAAQMPAFPLTSVTTESSPSPGCDGGDLSCCDLLSLRSDSSMSSEPASCRRSDEDDTTSVTASSVMSLFHRVQLDPLEKDWLRSSAVGNLPAQRRLLSQDPSLVLKKTALHWAAKQGRQEAADMLLHSGADVNARSGYTALHLASIHGHQTVVQTLIHTYNAKTNIRDYHGRTAAHYWSSCRDVFNKPDDQAGEPLSRGRRTQHHALPSLLLTRSRSQGQLHLELAVLQPASHDALDLHV
ncbi:ankyrin repeat domain-containing protein SOWAHC [Parambassis ranga]|uniref:Ankyrin repeat domain-containing protein SOWAHC n=1 Tax=Parambassis ranga TaxID=210632 RepID=A0A6P7KA89_9TELE|nr:ankyrin repeat domain-containing protein SOWAHC-like [Parambassis ranga]